MSNHGYCLRISDYVCSRKNAHHCFPSLTSKDDECSVEWRSRFLFPFGLLVLSFKLTAQWFIEVFCPDREQPCCCSSILPSVFLCVMASVWLCPHTSNSFRTSRTSLSTFTCRPPFVTSQRQNKAGLTLSHALLTLTIGLSEPCFVFFHMLNSSETL